MAPLDLDLDPDLDLDLDLGECVFQTVLQRRELVERAHQPSRDDHDQHDESDEKDGHWHPVRWSVAIPRLGKTSD